MNLSLFTVNLQKGSNLKILCYNGPNLLIMSRKDCFRVSIGLFQKEIVTPCYQWKIPGGRVKFVGFPGRLMQKSRKFQRGHGKFGGSTSNHSVLQGKGMGRKAGGCHGE